MNMGIVVYFQTIPQALSHCFKYLRKVQMFIGSAKYNILKQYHVLYVQSSFIQEFNSDSLRENQKWTFIDLYIWNTAL